jgi:polar amino acid transport system substrate-binding protein
MARTPHRTALATLVLIPALLLASCGSDSKTNTASTDTTAKANAAAAPAGLVSSGTLSVCSDTPYEPFEFKDASGKDTGYDMDLLRAIGDRAGLKLAVKDLPFDGILGSMAAGDCDVVASAVTITPERAKQVDFSDPYFDADQSLLVKTDQATELASLDKLAGKTIGVQSGTTGETYANEHAKGASVKGFEDSDALFAAIESGSIDAILQDLPVNAYRTTKDKSLKVVETYKTGEQYGFAVKQGNTAVLVFINDGLKALKANGTFDQIYTKYFGSAGS